MSDKTQSSDRFEAVTPSDTIDLDKPTRAIYVGGAGDVVAVDTTGNAVTFVGVASGSVLPVVLSRVNATGTTATNIVALF